MNATTLRTLFAAPAAAIVVTTSATLTAPTASAGSVWQDALLWFNGPVDANNDGKWTGNVSEGGVPRKCDGTGGASCEMPDARHGALASSNTQKLNYSTGAATVYQQSGFLIRTNDVHFTAWGNKTVAWPCLYLPQTTNENTCYAHRWQMFDGAAPASGATVTLDPLASDKRAFPTTLTPDATFRIPFSIDKYAADKAHWLRFKAQSGSASGMIGVALDGIALDPLTASSGHNSYIWIPGRKFTLGDHVLTLSRTDGGSGNVTFDVIELGGAWSAGIDQPLGGEFADGRYVTTHELAPAFEVARDFVPSSNLVVEATFTPKRRVGAGTGNANASIAILESPGRYWHLFLDESRAGRHTFGLTELGGTSQIQSTLSVLEKEGATATWEYGRAYRLRLALGEGVVTGEVYDAETSALLFRLRYGLAPGHVASGRPAFKFYRLIGDFEDLTASAADSPLALAAGRENCETLPTPTPSCREGERGTAAPHSRFYRTTRDAAGKWWFVDPAGNPMFLSGIGAVSHAGHYSAALGYAPYARTVARKYPTLEDWATNTLSRLTSWGFNFLSSPSAILLRRGLPHAHVLGIGQQFATYGDEFDILPCDGGPCSGFPNVFHPLWPEFCRFRAEFVCAQDRDDPWTLGWYIDNELSWWGDKRKFTTPPASGLFDAAAKKTPGHPAREALEAFLAERGFTDAALSAPVEVKREFVRLCARKYFEETTRAIREIDPNHLILGCRFAGLPSADPVVWEECGRFCDVVSVNIYPMADLDCGVAVDWPGPNAQLISDLLGERARMAGKPVIVTEWSFSALDSGLPCTHGAGQRFFTQKERAKATSIFARTMWAMPECAGYVYFMWCDQPAVGRNGPQSENTNYGLVNADDEPYAEQVAALAALQLNPAASRAAAVPQPHEVVSPKAEDFARRAEVRSTPPGPSGATPLSEGGNGNAGSSEVSSTTPATIPPPRGGCREATGGVLRVEQSSLLVGGKGVFSAMLREYSRGGVSWTAATEAMTADKSAAAGEPPAPPENGVRDIAFRGETASGPFEVAIRFHEPAGRDFFIAELLSVKNSGTAPLPFESVFFRLLPVEKEGAEAARGDDVFEPPKEGQPTPIPPSLWRPWGSGAWILPDGTVLGLLTPRTTGVIIRFWRDSALHSDAQMHYPRKDLAPGETWTPDYHPFVVGGATSGGEAGWRSFCDKVKTVEKK